VGRFGPGSQLSQSGDYTGYSINRGPVDFATWAQQRKTVQDCTVFCPVETHDDCQRLLAYGKETGISRVTRRPRISKTRRSHQERTGIAGSRPSRGHEENARRLRQKSRKLGRFWATTRQPTDCLQIEGEGCAGTQRIAIQSVLTSSTTLVTPANRRTSQSSDR
jgi:hypothetical protein